MPTEPLQKQSSMVVEKKEEPVTNEDVVAMVQAQMDEANILGDIRSASKVDFDLTPGGQIKLARSGIKGTILAVMKQRARANGPISASGSGDQASNNNQPASPPKKSQKPKPQQ